jgi:uncharacterized protein YdhG (YjbR/CyaY superfamily)
MPRHVAAAGRTAVNAYLAATPSEARKALEKVRKAIIAAAPDAEEGISYRVPAFRLDGRPLVCYAAFKEHCSLFPMSSAVMRAHAAELEAYETSRGTIRFPPDKPLSSALVKKLVRARIAELRRGAK